MGYVRVATPRCHAMALNIVIFIVFMTLQTVQSEKAMLAVASKELLMLVGETNVFHMSQVGSPETGVKLQLKNQHPDVIKVTPETLDIASGSGSTVYDFTVTGLIPGHSEVTFEVTPPDAVDSKKAFIRIGVMISTPLHTVSVIVGWIYFLAWTISFYPQIYENYRRQSVVGLNFDFLGLNIMGFTMYSLFNCGLYWSAYVQSQYFDRYPRGHNPVQLNDVFFSVHAALATLFTIGQTRVYERAQQRVSTIARSILGCFVVIFIITGVLALSGAMMWLDFLLGCSYIKLTITFIKYVPQALMNYRRKSTVGWSIGNILCDFTGGTLSIFQMILNAINFDDWLSFFGDFTKFGLGFFSLSFDLLFMTQHYILYSYKNKQEHKTGEGTVSISYYKNVRRGTSEEER